MIGGEKTFYAKVFLMKTLKEQFIVEAVRQAVERVGDSRSVRIMDLGCGTANYVPALVEVFPTIEYVGVEPIETSFKAAQKNLMVVSNARLHFQLGYDSVPDELENSFDLVFSLSVLEHIKQLDKFIELSAKYVRQGGLLVHRHDLGHALHPHSYKERFHVWLGNNWPQVLPERQFVRYVPETEVRELYEKCGVKPIKTTFHQMPNMKALEKELKGTNSTAVDELFVWEMKHQGCFAKIPLVKREKLLPTIAVWGEKQ
jgi:SAM-dependent methyltransferase